MLFPKYYTVNNLNFNPSLIKTHNGIFLDNSIEELSYFFTQNEKVTMDEEIEISDKEGNILYDEMVIKLRNQQELLVVIIFGCKVDYNIMKEIIKNY
jgi:hypothetical protein